METKKKNYFVEVIIVVVVGILTMCFGIGMTIQYFKEHPNSVEEITNITKTEKEVTVTDAGIADAVEKIYDAVVTVVNYKNDTAYSSGTGFVYKVEGDKAYILTNYHVINGGNKFTVTLTKGEILNATLVGGDKYSDVAILQVNAKDISTIASLGSSDDARIGDTAFAVGSPVSEEYGWTVTRGILSGKDRTITVSLSNSMLSNDTVAMNVLQTDVAINSGNSGGPLCNSNGEVIGITSSKVAATGVEGIGFAIPIEDALTIAEKLEKGEEIQRPYIGINMMELEAAKYYSDLETNAEYGVFISSVVESSPAAKAGIKAGDVVIEIEGKKIETISVFRSELYKYNVGDEVKFKLIRNKKEQEVTVKLGTNS